ncbi:hypothetical protein CPB85DRAFT_1255779 [Mucidula mucida]|nr:hypothetical protein CPB85DRAFT_1255779 [Mucidula mucida]
MSSRVYYHSTSSSCTSLTVGVFQSSAGVTASLAVIVAYKLFPSLSPPAPEFRRTSTPTYSQRRSRRSSVDTVATETSDISIDSVSTLVEPEIKRKHRLSSDDSEGDTALGAQKLYCRLVPFTTSTVSSFSPVSDTTSTYVKAAIKRARRNSADCVARQQRLLPGDDVTELSPLVKNLCSLVPEECDFLEEAFCRGIAVC